MDGSNAAVSQKVSVPDGRGFGCVIAINWRFCSAEGRTCFADFLPSLSICSLAGLILCPNTQQSTLMFIHPASANRCLVLLRVMRGLESDSVGLGETHKNTLNRSLVHYRTHTYPHTHLPRGNLKSEISLIFMSIQTTRTLMNF